MYIVHLLCVFFARALPPSLCPQVFKPLLIYPKEMYVPMPWIEAIRDPVGMLEIRLVEGRKLRGHKATDQVVDPYVILWVSPEIPGVRSRSRTRTSTPGLFSSRTASWSLYIARHLPFSVLNAIREELKETTHIHTPTCHTLPLEEKPIPTSIQCSAMFHKKSDPSAS